jgi:uncharacterized membrane protein
MENPDQKNPEDRTVIGFILTVMVGIGLTVVAVPVLFLATCIPLMQNNQQPTWIAFGLYGAAATIGGLVIAIKTRNRGIRWGVIALFCLAVFAAIYYLRSIGHVAL